MSALEISFYVSVAGKDTSVILNRHLSPYFLGYVVYTPLLKGYQCRADGCKRKSDLTGRGCSGVQFCPCHLSLEWSLGKSLKHQPSLILWSRKGCPFRAPRRIWDHRSMLFTLYHVWMRWRFHWEILCKNTGFYFPLRNQVWPHGSHSPTLTVVVAPFNRAWVLQGPSNLLIFYCPLTALHRGKIWVVILQCAQGWY